MIIFVAHIQSRGILASWFFWNANHVFSTLTFSLTFISCQWEQVNTSVTLLRSIWFPCSLTCISYLLKARKFFSSDLIILPAILSAVFLQ